MWVRCLKSFLVVAAVVFGALFVVEQLKGYGSADSAWFSLLWAGISGALFAGFRVFYLRRGVECPLCDDPLNRKPPEQR